MKKSSQVLLTMLSSIAFAACKQGARQADWAEVKRCVDKENRVVEERLCDEQQRGATGGHAYPHRWYYGGRGGYRPGDYASDGGYEPSPGKSYRSPGLSTASRGGLGGAGRAATGSGAGHVGS